jgi:hypothetical protein
MISPSSVQAVTFSTSGQVARSNGQRVVAVDGELLRQPGEHALLRGGDHAGLAVHQLLGPDDLAAESRANGLVPQADPQDRQLAREMADRRHRDTRLGRRARPGRNHQPVGPAQPVDPSSVISSLRNTSTSAPSSPKYWTML